MASSSIDPSSSKPSGSNRPDRISAKQAVLRNTLRYTISAKEYETLHKYIISRSKILKRNVPTVARVEKLVERPGRDDYNAAAVRASVRVFMATAAGLKIWGLIKERVLGRVGARGKKAALWKSPNFRLSLSLSMILLLHRILFRFFTRLRAHLLTDEARPFRLRNKNTSKTLTSNLAPAVGASLAGFLLALYPSDQLRVTIAIYTLSRAAEFAYNLAEEEGWIWGKKERPWWWGSWLIFPFTCGQLLHAFTFDRDCFPKEYGDFIIKNSPAYVHPRPEDYPPRLSWPGTYDMVDSLAQMAKLNYPPFVSPILFPNSQTLPLSLTKISPLTSPAHPLIKSLSCATLHPTDPSCLRTYLTYWIRAFPSLARFFTVVFAVLSLPKYRAFYKAPIQNLNKLASLILRYATFVAGAVGTSWGAICLFQQFLPKNFLATQRFFLGGMLGGLWGFVVRRDARSEFLYGARASIDSLWKVGRKRGWWRGLRGGDVGLFVASLMVINAVYERDARALRSGLARRGVSYLRGEGLKDVVAEEKKRIEDEVKEKRAKGL